ncbi:MAG: DUF1553 domain-containing protein [Planctomycetes bacterium]|nr:DUF1553 domain-containing protein [Planctomycetota bacterium]
MLSLGSGLLASGIAAIADEKNRFFESEIRPLLEKHCLECHRGSDPEGGLTLEHRGGWHDAAVVVPGRPQSSRLLQVVQSDDPDERMPPPDAGEPLAPEQVRAIEKWIADGAFDPRDPPANEKPTATGPKKRNRVFEITEEDRNYWAFQPFERESDDSKTDAQDKPLDISQAAARIDALLERQRSDIPVAPRADARTLIRRAVYDLWGIVPTPEMVQQFQQNLDDNSWRSLIDSLLSSRRYGEQWGRHWLDWVRYAETNGYERDGIKPNAWRYRDYVIDSFASNKPYDQFIIEQLAGDEWAREQGWSATNETERWRQSIIATGFYRLHQWDDEPDDTQQAEFDDADDVLISIGTTFLGLTIGCARCHDHKFDPISQRDYYAMLSCIRGVDPYGQSKKGGGGRGTGRIQQPLVEDAVHAAWEKEKQVKLEQLRDRLAKTDDPSARPPIETEIRNLQESKPPFDVALVVANRNADPPETFVLYRGDIHAPRDPVGPDTPAIFSEQVGAPKLDDAVRNGAGASGRRLSLARWIANPRHPLTARVMVNRIWQRHFGIGIVPTPDDFGKTGIEPSNPELLDFLAQEFIRSGWSIHHMHRLIMSTQAYAMASNSVDEVGATKDPDVRWVWRQQMRRMDAEAIRDSILAISGTLTDKQGGPSIYPRLSPEVRDAANPVSLSQWNESPLPEQSCRSVYLIVKRSLKIPFLETMDFANRSSPAGVRPVTTTAPQALLLLNDPWVREQSQVLVARLRAEAGSDSNAMIERLWLLAYQRTPAPDEREIALQFIEEQDPRDEQETWISLCRAVLNSNEFLYID